jgi:hypothetical protein
MNTNRYYTRALAGLLVVLLAAPAWAFAQDADTGKTFRQEELDQMLAPIALYPDSLLAQILVASTYPAQVTEADRWVRENGNLKGDALNSALDRMDWDLSVKALVPFPQVLAMMDDKLSWTDRLGEAFLAQQTDVMSTVQKLRARAQAQGNLNSTPQQTVVVKDNDIEIAPTNPEMVYVPAYDPSVIYGSWWYPAYPPYAWAPIFPGGPFITYGLLGFAAGIAVASAWSWGWGSWDWGHGDININVNRNMNINRNHIGGFRTASWHHEMGRRGLSSSRGFGKHDADRMGRPSAASVEKGLHNGTAQSRQAGLHSGHGQTNRNASLGRSHSGNLAHGNNSRGNNNLSRSGNNFTHGNTNFSHANNFSHGNANLGSSGSFAHGGGSFGGSHGGGGFAHGGGGGGGRHCGKHC